MEVTPDVLRITQTGHVHYQIIVFCEKLRVARGLPTKSHLDPKKFVLATRTARAKAILGQVASVNVSVPASLSSILEQFKQPAGTEILIDRPALAAAGISENTTRKFKADRLPQGEALRKLLDPWELAWRAVGANTLQVTTQKRLPRGWSWSFTPLPSCWPVSRRRRCSSGSRRGSPAHVWGEGGVMSLRPALEMLDRAAIATGAKDDRGAVDEIVYHSRSGRIAFTRSIQLDGCASAGFSSEDCSTAGLEASAGTASGDGTFCMRKRGQ